MSTIPAIVPAAGRGTRLHPITRYVSKPMLPVGARPAISWTLEEAFNAGLSPVIVVRSPDDDALRNFLECEYPETVRVTVQPEPLGLADAALRAYQSLDKTIRCALMLPDNVVLGGSGIQALLGTGPDEHLVFGTTEVPRSKARYFGNSGRYTTESADGDTESEIITGLQEKGTGSFLNASDDWPCRRAVARTLLPPEFFERTADREPDPSSGEIDDVPVYRAMIESSTVYGVPIDGDIYDMGTPERYLKLCAALHEQRESNP